MENQIIKLYRNQFLNRFSITSVLVTRLFKPVFKLYRFWLGFLKPVINCIGCGSVTDWFFFKNKGFNQLKTDIGKPGFNPWLQVIPQADRAIFRVS